jgi:hypothetical protein
LLTPIQLLQNTLVFPFEFEVYKESVIENTIKQNEMASTIKDVTIFWEAIAFKLNQPKNEIAQNNLFVKDPVKRIIYMKYKPLFPYYKEYVKKNGLNDLDSSSLLSLLTSKGNKDFIPNTTQKLRDKSIIKKGFGSCYMFRYDDIPEGNGIIINDVELNL